MENVIRRARNLLDFLPEAEAVEVLVADGAVTAEDAFLAVRAARILGGDG